MMGGPLDYHVDAEWRRVCGPYVKPPKMNAWRISVAPSMDLADSGRIADDMLRQIDHIMRPRHQLMESAVRMVFVLGYGTDDCLIQHQIGSNSIREPSVEIDRLVVRGQSCFEVEVKRSALVDYQFTYTTTPRLITWPPVISDAQQVSATPSSGPPPR